MANKAEIALATAFSFLDDVGKTIRALPDDLDAVSANRPDILNTISLATRKITEAEQLDPRAVYKFDDKTFNIPIFKSIALDSEGFIHSICGDEKKALSIFEQAIALHPENAMAWFHKGLSLASLLKKNDAIAALNKAVELDEENVEYYKALEHVKSISGSEIATAKALSAGRKAWSGIKLFFLFLMLLPFIMIIGGFMSGDKEALASGFGLLVVFGLSATAYDKVKSFFS